jgi:hypothetical protein
MVRPHPEQHGLRIDMTRRMTMHHRTGATPLNLIESIAGGVLYEHHHHHDH